MVECRKGFNVDGQTLFRADMCTDGIGLPSGRIIPLAFSYGGKCHGNMGFGFGALALLS